MNGGFAQGAITFTADLPQEVIDKVIANTKEDMDKWLEAGNTFDLSDGADRTVTYISFPKGTKPEDVVRVARFRAVLYGCMFGRLEDVMNEVCDNVMNEICDKWNGGTE